MPANEYPPEHEKDTSRKPFFGRKGATVSYTCAITLFACMSMIVAVLLPLIVYFSRVSTVSGARNPLPISYTPKPFNNIHQPISRCGNSSSEARALGCHFDVMSFSWLPMPCYDEQLVEDFLARKEWKYYQQPRSGGVENEVPMKDVFAANHQELYVTWEFHKAHCVYMLRKLHRAVVAGNPVDGYIGNYMHTKHCTELLLKEELKLESITTRIFVKYPSCEQ